MHGQVCAAGGAPLPGRARVRCRSGRQTGAGTIAPRAHSAPGGQLVDVGQLQRVARTARSAPPAQIHDQGKRRRDAVAAVRPAPARSPRGRAAHQVASCSMSPSCSAQRARPGRRRWTRSTTRASACSMPWRPPGRRRHDRHLGAQRTRWPAARCWPAAARTAMPAPAAQDQPRVSARARHWRRSGRCTKSAIRCWLEEAPRLPHVAGKSVWHPRMGQVSGGPPAECG